MSCSLYPHSFCFLASQLSANHRFPGLNQALLKVRTRDNQVEVIGKVLALTGWSETTKEWQCPWVETFQDLAIPSIASTPILDRGNGQFQVPLELLFIHPVQYSGPPRLHGARLSSSMRTQSSLPRRR